MDPKAFFKISYGLYTVTAKKGTAINGQIANALIQVTAEPPALAIGLNVKNLTNEFIKESKAFGVSILSQDTPLGFIGQFGFKSGRDIKKFDQVNYKTGITGAPLILDNTLAVLEPIGTITDWMHFRHLLRWQSTRKLRNTILTGDEFRLAWREIRECRHPRFFFPRTA